MEEFRKTDRERTFGEDSNETYMTGPEYAGVGSLNESV